MAKGWISPFCFLIVLYEALRKPPEFQKSSKDKCMMGDGVCGGDSNPVRREGEKQAEGLCGL